MLLPACILGQLLLLPCSVTSSKVFVGCPLQTLPTKNIGVGIQSPLAKHSINGLVSLLLYRDETLGQFLAGLTWCRLDFDHTQLREKHQSRQEGPGSPHDPEHNQRDIEQSIRSVLYDFKEGSMDMQVCMLINTFIFKSLPKKLACELTITIFFQQHFFV